jgi:serine/threonine protein kinase
MSLGRFAVSRWLRKDQTALAVDDSGRQVVLKVLDQDCLLKGRLHPNIRDRLERVRELAHPAVAHLHGVERLEGKSYLVWEFVEGRTFEEYAASAADAGNLDILKREIALAVRVLHATGIVHGAIHGRNIIIDRVGKVRLTHISPLLYDDPASDERELKAAVGLPEETLPSGAPAEDTEDGALRRRIRGLVLLTVLAGGLGSAVLWWVLHTTPPPPLVPPEAPGSLTGR